MKTRVRMLGEHRVIQGDCLDVLKQYSDDSVDLVITSPPFEDARSYGLGYDLKGQEWVDWCVQRFAECYRISRGLVAWNVQGRTRQFQWSATPALLAADLHRMGIRLRNPPIFHRVGIPGSGGPDWFRSDYEWIICASKGKLPWSDNTACGHPPRHAVGGHPSHRTANGSRVSQARVRKDRGFSVKPGEKSSFDENPFKQVEIANPGNVLKISVGGGHLGSKIAHENEAPFPEALPEFFIKSCCPPGGIVLDPFGGSGTTLAVAVKTGRIAHCIDIRENQAELMVRRHAEASQSSVSHLPVNS